MQKLHHFLQSISDWTGRGIAWLTLLMVLTTFLIVVLLNLFQPGWINALQDAVVYMHAVMFMLGVAYTLKQDGHVRVDIFYQHMSPRCKAIVNMLGTLLLLFPVCIFILYSSWDYVADSWQYREKSIDTDGLPWVYLLKTTLLIMPVLVMLQGLAQFMSALQVFIHGADPDKAIAEDQKVTPESGQGGV